MPTSSGRIVNYQWQRDAPFFYLRGGGGGGGRIVRQNPFFGGQLGQKPILFFFGGGGTFGHSPLHIGEYIIVFLVLGSPMFLYQNYQYQNIPYNTVNILCRI